MKPFKEVGLVPIPFLLRSNGGQSHKDTQKAVLDDYS
jgi:hypothetical protein